MTTETEITWYPMAPGQRRQLGLAGERWHDREPGERCTRCRADHGAPVPPEPRHTLEAPAASRIPAHLDSACAVDLCPIGPDCPEAVKVDPATGRAYITISHAGFNSPANNRTGYGTIARARLACRRYAGGRQPQRYMRRYATPNPEA